MGKKGSFLFLSLSVLLIFSTAAVADGGSSENTIIYPAENPVFTVTFPDNWETETEDNILHATPEDSSIYLGIWALEEAKDLDAALDAVDEAVSSLVSDLKVGEVETSDVNGIRFMFVDGKGKDEEGDNVDVSVALFSPDGKQIFILLYFGTPEAEQAHEDELTAILKSINEKE